jgi:DnaJ family protein B protein 4
MPEEFAYGGMPGGGGGGHSFKFNFSAPEDTFRSFREGSGLGGDIFEELLRSAGAGGGSATGSSRRSMRGSFGENMRGARQPTPEVTTVERALPLSLEDLFNGVTKKMKIKRKMFDDSGKRTTTDTVLEVPIKPGLKKGSKIRFKGVGDQEEGGQQDLVFIVEEVSHSIYLTPFPISKVLHTDIIKNQKPHALFSREGDDIVHTVDLDLKEALTGWKRTVTTIDKKILNLDKAGPTQPGSADTYPGLGMPISKKPGQRGNFVVRYNVKFPMTLTTTQKQKLREIL